MRLGTPLSPSATRVLLLGSGELGKEVALELQRFGVEVIAADRYANAPAMQVAHRIALLTPPPAAPDSAKATDADKRRTALGRQVTAADLSPDNRTLAVLTYDRLWLYPRARGQSWAQAVAHPPRTEPLPWLHQAEALAWMPDGKGLLATGEFSPAPLVYLPAEP